jgi:ribonuclease BN (tRNA processing enzyme)
MARVMSPPHFPVRLEQLRGDWSVRAIEEGIHELEGFSVTAIEIPHKQARTFGYRVSDGRATVAYLSDHWPAAVEPGPDGLGVLHEAALTLAEGADLLIHDAQYTAAEYAERGPFGHAAVEYAVALAEKAGARELALFHHDPDRTDDELNTIVAGLADAPVRVRAAAEGDVVDL